MNNRANSSKKQQIGRISTDQTKSDFLQLKTANNESINK